MCVRGHVTIYRLGKDIHEVIGYTATPWTGGKGESLSHSLLRCANGLTGVLNAHLNSIPMAKVPFFQIFGSKVCFGTAGILNLCCID